MRRWLSTLAGDPTRRWLLAGLVAATVVLPIGLWPGTAKVLAPRDIELDLVFRGTGERAALEWTDAEGATNGYYFDLARERTPSGLPGLHRRFCLPWYEITNLRLAWTGGGDVDVVTPPRVATRFFGKPAARRDIGIGGVVENAGSRAIPFTLPDRVWWGGWVMNALAAAACSLGAFAVFGGLWRFCDAWDTLAAWFAFGPRAARRWIVITGLIAACAPAVWLACWSPVLMEGDGSAFVWFAQILWDTGRFTHFDGWRLPGYGTIIAPFVGLLHDYSTGIGIMQCAMGIATVVLCFDLLRRRIATTWAIAAALVIGCDPMVLMWQRYVLSESLAALLVTLAVWMVDRLLPRGPVRPRLDGVVVPAAFAGLTAFAIYTRANFQTFAIVLPLVLAWGWWRVGRRWASAWPAAACVALAAVAVAPAFFHNHRLLGRYALVVGADHNRCVFGWQNNAIDINQIGAFTFDEYRGLQARLDTGAFRELQFTDFLVASPTIPVPAGTHPWTARDVRSGVVVRESLARQPDLFAWRVVQGVPSVLGFFVPRPFYYSHTVDWMSRVLRGRFDDRTRTNWDDDFDMDWFPQPIRSVLERPRREVGGMRGSNNALVFHRVFEVYRYVRPVIIIAFLATGLLHLRRRDAAMTAAAALIVGNALAIALVQFTGMDRYGTPFYPLMAVAAFAGVFGAGAPARGERRS